MLEKINKPDDLKKLNNDQLNRLAGDIREEIIDTLSKNGGHLASNLGIVEITVALNKVFSGKNDRIFYDVGHQCYAQKLISGRKKQFSTLRKHGGISGFASYSEDKSDSFTAGHASTAISAALGCCRARDIKGTDGNVIAVVGDGALTGGLAYEAMNDAGQANTRLIVIYNDNNMSISRNVGALSKQFTRVRQSYVYTHIKSRAQKVLERIPVVGVKIYRVIKRIRDSVKSLFIGNKFCESLGFKYVGPVNGHDIKQLTRVFKKASQYNKPIFIHCVTQKGYGYEPAMKAPELFHGLGPFDRKTGKPLKNEPASYGQYASKMLCRMANVNNRICAVTAAMRTGTCLENFERAHKERFFDVGIAEEHAVTMAAGLASEGMKPYVGVYSTFLQRAYDQILNDVCINSLPVTFLIDRAGLVGADGMTHNGAFDISYLRTMPNMAICAPRDIHALDRLMAFSVKYDKPLAIRYPKTARDLGWDLDRRTAIKVGMWETLIGGNIMIIATGSMVEKAMRCALTMANRGYEVGVTDAMFIKPIDTKTLYEIAGSSKLIVTLEENTINGGLGEEITRLLSNHKVRVLALGLPDRFIPHGTVEEQLKDCGLDDETIIDTIIANVN